MTSFQMDGVEYRTYDHLFAVSACGKVLRSFAPYTPRSYRKDGYLTLGRQRLMHRVVATCWVDNPNNEAHVHHINENRRDNRACNLQWVSHSGHIKDHHHKTTSYPRTPETIEKMRASKLGVKQSKESNAKRSAAMKLHRLLVPVLSKTKCKYKGVVYESLKEACLVASVTRGCFVRRCRSKNFPDYELLTTV